MTDTLFAVLISLLGLGLIGGYAYMVARFTSGLRSARRTTRQAWLAQQESTAWPRADVLLSLRGWDVRLVDSLWALLEQDHANYGVTVVVDSTSDPAWGPVQQIAEASGGRMRVLPLTNRRTTCCLKNSALLQAIETLPADCAIVAVMDSDVVPHRSWLSQLTAPLADPRIGATTGNRWYLPVAGYWGTWIRSAWGAGATVQMIGFGCTWGGTMAVRMEELHRSGLLERWSLSFNDDLVMGNLVRGLGLRVQFVPSLIMPNREPTNTSGCIVWLKRQLVHARHYQHVWGLVAFTGLLGAPILFLPVVALIAGWCGWWQTAVMAMLAPLQYLASMWLFWVIAQRQLSIGAAQSLRSDAPDYGRSLLAMIVATLVQTYAVLHAQFVRLVRWRGVDYFIASPWDVRVLNDQPFAAHGAPSQMSI